MKDKISPNHPFPQQNPIPLYALWALFHQSDPAAAIIQTHATQYKICLLQATTCMYKSGVESTPSHHLPPTRAYNYFTNVGSPAI